MVTIALQILVIVIAIGIIAGLVVNRYGRGWFGSRASDPTVSLVGIAGAFMGFHVGSVLGLVLYRPPNISWPSLGLSSPYGLGAIANAAVRSLRCRRQRISFASRVLRYAKQTGGAPRFWKVLGFSGASAIEG